MTWSPLGGFAPFESWSGRPRTWGPDGGARVWFAGAVVDGLATVIDEHLAAPRPGRFHDTATAAIGCVPWLTHRGVAERLARLSACCIVIDKGRYSAIPRVLVNADNGFPNVLPRLREVNPGGTPEILGPYREPPRFAVGPVRAVGMSGSGTKPLLHAKLLVLGHVIWGEDDFGQEHDWFRSSSVWWGSANWTERSADHLEMGVWSDDPALAREATAFLDTLIGFSEPLTSVAPGPEADLVAVDYDSDPMWQAVEASRYDVPPWADDKEL